MKHIALAALISAALVSTAHARSDDRNGFYAGLVTGYTLSDFDAKAGPVGGAATQSEQVTMHGGDFGFVGGYQHEFADRFFLAGEIDLLGSIGEEENIFAQDVDLRAYSAWGVYLKPGMHLNDRWSTFLTLGARWSTYEVTNNAASYQETDTGAGFVAGVGVDYLLGDDVTLSAEYNHIESEELKFQYAPGATDSRFDPTLDVLKLALKYHF